MSDPIDYNSMDPFGVLRKRFRIVAKVQCGWRCQAIDDPTLMAGIGENVEGARIGALVKFKPNFAGGVGIAYVVKVSPLN